MSDDRRSNRHDRRRSRSPDDTRHNYHDDREKRSRGDDGRGNHRDRDRGTGRDIDRRGDGSRTEQRFEKEDVSKTVIMKGLPAHTTQSALYNVLAPYLPQEIRLIAERDSGDCKGFAFIVFPSIEHAQFFMAAFAGSSGDSSAPQFIIGNRAVILGYARDDRRDRETSGGDRGSGRNDRDDRDREKKSKSDWFCDACEGQNFARRAECYRCGAPKKENATFLPSPDTLTLAGVGCDTPSPFLAVMGFGPFVIENAIIELFRQFAVVKSVNLLRDGVTGFSKGAAFVEFYTVEHAMHTIQQTSLGPIYLDSSPLKISYAKESFRLGHLKQNELLHQQRQLFPHPQPPASHVNLAVEAVQSARWSGSHGLGNPPIPTGLTGPPGVLAPKLKPVWPPSFETDGGAYIFQAQSGSFLEPKSQFFYCPKSRLYYSCADGIYYNCVVSSTEVNFIRFNPPLPLEPDSGLITENSDVSEKSATEVEVTAQRKPVVLSMGFNMGKGKNTSVKIINVATKKATGDILKWGAVQVQEDNPAEINRVLSSGASRGKGKSSSVILENSTTPIPAATSVSVKDTAEPTRAFNNSTANSGFCPDPRIATVTAASSAADAIALITGIAPASAPAPALPVTGASAEPELVACLLCRRQFASPEQLLRHERESKLHKDNMILAVKAASDDLARQLAAYSASSSNVPEHSAQDIQDASNLSEGYRDRASERRETHRPSDETGTMYRDRERGRERKKEDTREHRKSSSQRHETESQSVPSSSLQDSSNPGTQMLRKMGWNEGQGLGRGGSGAEESVGVLLASDMNSNSGKRVQGIGGAAAPQTILYHGSGREYKESLLRAAKARYDQVNSN